MSFSDKDETLIKNLHQFEENG